MGFREDAIREYELQRRQREEAAQWVAKQQEQRVLAQYETAARHAVAGWSRSVGESVSNLGVVPTREQLELSWLAGGYEFKALFPSARALDASIVPKLRPVLQVQMLLGRELWKADTKADIGRALSEAAKPRQLDADQSW